MVTLERGKKYVLWDGDCNFCLRCARYADDFNEGNFVLVPYQQVDESELRRVGLNHYQCSRELKAITSDSRVFGGAFALNYFLWHHHRWRVLIALIYAVPVLALMEVLLYQFIAQNRVLISKILDGVLNRRSKK